ncbi:MAG: HAD family hydrolase [Pseudomonadota bacterium]
MRIAMWSGPRNLSTAMMYAFGQRADCAVSDEPFYAAYLSATGIDHPMREAVLSAGETDPRRVAQACLGNVPDGRALWYQKHMAHHMVPDFPLDWMSHVKNVFLIRHPARVVASYARKREDVELSDLGFAEQVALYERLSSSGMAPTVIDSAAVRAAPEAALRALCERLGIRFDPAMLSWRAGGHAADGIWAAHWYGAVHRSTGFEGPEGPLPVLEGAYEALALAAQPHYDRLAKVALTV